MTDYLYRYIILVSSEVDGFQKGLIYPRDGKTNQLTQKRVQRMTNEITETVSLQRWSASQSLESVSRVPSENPRPCRKFM